MATIIMFPESNTAYKKKERSKFNDYKRLR